MPPPTRSKRKGKDYAYLVFSGAAMGAADVVPGVSGGTMAFILGVYEELIHTIKSVNTTFLRLLWQRQFRAAWQHVNGSFIVALGGGLGTAILALARLLSWLLEQHPELLYAFFFGLVVASIVAISAHVHWRPSMCATLVVGTALAYIVVGLVPLDMPSHPVTLFLSGAVAICAMILPGISGSFILLILGQYATILNAVSTLDVRVLVPAAIGMAVGLLSFARLLSWLLKHYHQVTVTLLVGFMLGSLRRIWPFKETLEYMQNRHGEWVPLQQVNVWPDIATPVAWAALGLAVLGFLLISLLDHQQSGHNPFIRLWTRSGKGPARSTASSRPPSR